MKVFTCIDHDSVWPVGVASVVVATNEEEARALLDKELAEHGLKPFAQSPYTLQRLPVNKPLAVVLRDGDY